MPRKYGFNGEASELENLAATTSHGPKLFGIDRLRLEARHGSWSPHNGRSSSDSHGSGIRHVIVMTVPNQNDVRLAHVGSTEPEWRILATSVEVRVEENDLTAVRQLEISVTGPSDREGVTILRKLSSG